MKKIAILGMKKVTKVRFQRTRDFKALSGGLLEGGCGWGKVR